MPIRGGIDRNSCERYIIKVETIYNNSEISVALPILEKILQDKLGIKFSGEIKILGREFEIGIRYLTRKRRERRVLCGRHYQCLSTFRVYESVRSSRSSHVLFHRLCI